MPRGAKSQPVKPVPIRENNDTDGAEIDRPSGALTLTRDEGGLLLNQRRFLAILAVEPDVRAAAARAGVNYRTVRGWIQTEPVFKRAIDRLFDQAIDAGKSLLNALVPKAAEMYERALEADSQITRSVTCPGCGEDFDATIYVPHWATQLKAGEVVLKRIGDLKEYSVRQTSGLIHHVNMSVEQQIALLAFQTGRPITPGMRRELEQLGLIEPDRSEGSDPDIIPGEIDRPN